MNAPKRPRDPNQLGKAIVDIATGQAEEEEAKPVDQAKQDAGRKGGAVRAQALTQKDRSRIARAAAGARWGGRWETMIEQLSVPISSNGTACPPIAKSAANPTASRTIERFPW